MAKQRFVAEWAEWRVELSFEKSRGRAELTGLNITPLVHPDRDEEPPILTATRLRSLPLGQLINEWRAFRRRINREAVSIGAVSVGQKRADLKRGRPVKSATKQLSADETIAFLDQLAGVTDDNPPRPGRPTYWTRERLAGVARIYRAAWEDGQNPTVAVYAHGQRRDATYRTNSMSMATKAVALARRRGLLPKTSRGRAGGNVVDVEEYDAVEYVSADEGRTWSPRRPRSTNAAPTDHGIRRRKKKQ